MSVIESNKLNGKYRLSESAIKTIAEINTYLYGLDMEDLQVITKGHFNFPVKFMDKDISELDISQRALNCLRRSNINTISRLLESVDSENNIKLMRNSGVKTAKEIMLALFIYQFNSLSSKDKKREYIDKVLELNGIYRKAL